MIDFVEQMMKTAGVEQENDCENCYQELDAFCLLYGCNEKGFPNFTAETQLEIIKLISDIDCLTIYSTEIPDYRYIFYLQHRKVRAEQKTFIEALAQLTTELMNAGKLDKKKVKEILENAR